MEELTVASLFAGIGGIDRGFQDAGFLPVWANDIDEFCKKTYDANHDIKLTLKSIADVSADEIPAVSVLTGGFPCQAFSVAGYRKGFEDERGNLVFIIFNLLEDMKKQNKLPQVIFLENVKNLKTHDKGQTYATIKEQLEEIGYHVTERVLNTSKYGNTPQNRERFYIVGFTDKEKFEKYEWPQEIDLTNTLDTVIMRDETVSDKYYYREGETVYYPMFRQYVNNQSSIFQLRRVYMRENKTGCCPTLTANMGGGGHNVPIILDNQNRIRKLTPTECLGIQGFPRNFIIPDAVCDSRIYKQAGNSVSVPVIKRIAIQIMKVI